MSTPSPDCLVTAKLGPGPKELIDDDSISHRPNLVLLVDHDFVSAYPTFHSLPAGQQKIYLKRPPTNMPVGGQCLWGQCLCGNNACVGSPFRVRDEHMTYLYYLTHKLLITTSHVWWPFLGILLPSVIRVCRNQLLYNSFSAFFFRTSFSFPQPKQSFLQDSTNSIRSSLAPSDYNFPTISSFSERSPATQNTDGESRNILKLATARYLSSTTSSSFTPGSSIRAA